MSPLCLGVVKVVGRNTALKFHMGVTLLKGGVRLGFRGFGGGEPGRAIPAAVKNQRKGPSKESL